MSCNFCSQRVNYYPVTLIISSASAELARHAHTASRCRWTPALSSGDLVPSYRGRGRPELTFHSAAATTGKSYSEHAADSSRNPLQFRRRGARSDIRYSSGWSGLILARRGRLGVGAKRSLTAATANVRKSITKHSAAGRHQMSLNA